MKEIIIPNLPTCQLKALGRIKEEIYQHLGTGKPFGKIMRATRKAEEHIHAKIGRAATEAEIRKAEGK